jgi:hypothetical protein
MHSEVPIKKAAFCYAVMSCSLFYKTNIVGVPDVDGGNSFFQNSGTYTPISSYPRHNLYKHCRENIKSHIPLVKF